MLHKLRKLKAELKAQRVNNLIKQQSLDIDELYSNYDHKINMVRRLPDPTAVATLLDELTRREQNEIGEMIIRHQDELADVMAERIRLRDIKAFQAQKQDREL